MNTPNGQAVQILLEELKDVYGTEWTTTLINIMTNEQKKDWFLRLDPNGTIISAPSTNLAKYFQVASPCWLTTPKARPFHPWRPPLRCSTS